MPKELRKLVTFFNLTTNRLEFTRIQLTFSSESFFNLQLAFVLW